MPNEENISANSCALMFHALFMWEQTTPDILKGQQELSQQTHEETAKQILFNYLKDG